MNWLTDILPGVKKKKKGEKGRSVADNVWTMCDQCAKSLYVPDLEKNLWVCPECDHHHRITAAQRAQMLFDDGEAGAEKIGETLRSVDLLKFGEGKQYAEKLAAATADDAAREAVRAYRGTVGAHPIVAVIFDFTFMGGSMGSVAGERFCRAAEVAHQAGCPFVTFAASGGARMQEGIASLFQMAKTTAALAELAAARLPHISILTDPTTGGVAASFAMIGDFVIAEPNALIGFAGPRVIQETVRERLPEGFQRSEFVQKQGGVDMIWHRHEMRERLAALLSLLAKPDDTPRELYSVAATSANKATAKK